VARDFVPSQHPRDRRGRFTKSRTVKATAKDKAAARKVAEGFAPKQVSRQERRTYLQALAGNQTGGLADVTAANQALRSGMNAPVVDRLNGATVELPDDILLSRRVPASAFGDTDPAALQGMKVRDAGFSPAQVGTVPAADGQVRMHIAAPAGTRAVVDPQTGEVALEPGSEMVVAKVEKNAAGGHDMWLTVLPKTGGDTKVRTPEQPSGRTPEQPPQKQKVAPPKPATPSPAAGDASHGGEPFAADRPEGEDQFRGDLMKLKVADLQAQMRERGLKPGKLRKSQLVDALVADEMGDDGEPGKADTKVKPKPRPTEKPQPTPDEPRPASAPTPPPPGPAPENPTPAPAGGNKPTAAGNAALAAAPLGLHRDNSGLTPEQSDALTAFQDGHSGISFKTIQKALRTGKPGSDGNRAAVTGIAEAMAASKLTSDVTVYRSVSSGDGMFGKRVDGDLTGMRWREDAFVPTASEVYAVEAFEHGRPNAIRMTISAPRGMGAVDLSDPDDSSEQELLLDKGHDFEVVGDRGVVDGIRRLDVRALPNEQQTTTDITPSASWQTARTGGPAFVVAPTITQAAYGLVLGKKIRRPERPRIEQAAVSYGRDPRDGDLNYVTVNAAVRGFGGDIRPDAAPELQQTVKDLDQLLAGALLKTDTLTYRGIQSPASAIPGWRDDGDNVGLEWTAEGYQSTTTDVSVAHEFASGVVSGGNRSATPMVARVLLPRGAPGMQMSPVVSEILTARNQRFRLVADRGVVDGVRQIDVEVIPG
jgi:hypothetical protein